MYTHTAPPFGITSAPCLHPSTPRSRMTTTGTKISIMHAVPNTTCLSLSPYPTLTISRPLFLPSRWPSCWTPTVLSSTTASSAGMTAPTCRYERPINHLPPVHQPYTPTRFTVTPTVTEPYPSHSDLRSAPSLPLSLPSILLLNRARSRCSACSLGASRWPSSSTTCPASGRWDHPTSTPHLHIAPIPRCYLPRRHYFSHPPWSQQPNTADPLSSSHPPASPQGEQQNHLLPVVPFHFYTDFSELHRVAHLPGSASVHRVRTHSPTSSPRSLCPCLCLYCHSSMPQPNASLPCMPP